jgi:hypothetical protein
MLYFGHSFYVDVKEGGTIFIIRTNYYLPPSLLYQMPLPLLLPLRAIEAFETIVGGFTQSIPDGARRFSNGFSVKTTDDEKH